MKLAILTFLCWLGNPKVQVQAHLAEDSTTTPSPIETIIPNLSYVLHLDCISCPYPVRHSNRNEWDKDPRANQLVLPLYIDGPRPNLYLHGEQLNPLWYDRRVPWFYNSPHPFAPPFTALQTGVNETLQREENNVGSGMPEREFELAYEFDAVTYAPGRKVWEWEVLVQFEITGLRHEEHVPKDIPFSPGQVDERMAGTVPGVTSVVRLVLGYTGFGEMRIVALELMPKDGMAKVASKQIEALQKAAELKGEKSITTADWGGRLRDVNGPDGKDMYTEHVSFQPGEWNDCGRKDELGRQIMCKLWDFTEDSPVLFRVLLVLVAMLLVGVFVWIVFVSWLAIRFLRGKKTEDVVTAKGENEALLLFGDEELEEEEKDGMEEKEIMVTHILDHRVGHVDEDRDSRQFGPFEHNVGDNV